MVLSEFQLNQCPDSLRWIIIKYGASMQTRNLLFFVETQFRVTSGRIYSSNSNDTDSGIYNKMFLRIHHDRRHKITSSLQCASPPVGCTLFTKNKMGYHLIHTFSRCRSSFHWLQNTSSEWQNFRLHRPRLPAHTSEICFPILPAYQKSDGS